MSVILGSIFGFPWGFARVLRVVENALEGTHFARVVDVDEEVERESERKDWRSGERRWDMGVWVAIVGVVVVGRVVLVCMELELR